jgi:alternate signal-mediated exported protein
VRRRRLRGIIAGLVGAAMALGGATFALWSDQAKLAGGTIQAGNLDITPLEGSGMLYDISADRTDTGPIDPALAALGLTGHAIDTDQDFNIVPGDTIAAVHNFQVTLSGDNLVAALSADLGSLVSENYIDNIYVHYQFLVNGEELDAADVVGGREKPVCTKPPCLVADPGDPIEQPTKQGTPGLPFDPSAKATLAEGKDLGGQGHELFEDIPDSEAPILAYVQAEGQADGLNDTFDGVGTSSDDPSDPNLIPIIPVPAEGEANVTLIVYVTFNDVTGQTDMGEVLELADLSLSLTQIRSNPDGVGNFTPEE